MYIKDTKNVITDYLLPYIALSQDVSYQLITFSIWEIWQENNIKKLKWLSCILKSWYKCTPRNIPWFHNNQLWALNMGPTVGWLWQIQTHFVFGSIIISIDHIPNAILYRLLIVGWFCIIISWYYIVCYVTVGL